MRGRGLPWWPRRHPVQAAAVALVVIGAIAGAALGWRELTDRSCAPGVDKLGGECVGVTDGGYSFLRPELKLVSRKIKDENDWVAKQRKPYVTIAFARPIDSLSGEQGHREGIEHGLQGAYAAQWRANHTAARGDTPLIRLLVADFGQDSAQWRHTAQQLVDAAKGDDDLVAVTGLSRSTTRTTEAMRFLSKHGIPLVSDVLTADRVPGVDTLARVAPTNSDEAQAAASYLKKQHVRRVQLVYDRNTDDSYVTSLRDAFRGSFTGDGRVVDDGGGAYDSRLGGLGNRFFSMNANFCADDQIGVVFFAGRSAALRTFVEQLSNRGCQDREFTVVTGDDATLLRSSPELDGSLDNNITLIYTGLTHPDMWDKAGKGAVDRVVVDFFAPDGPFRTKMFPGASLEDGQAVMAHDAVLTAIAATRLGAKAEDRPTPDRVAQNLYALNGTNNEVLGASGRISLDNEGYAINKAVPVLQRRPGERINLLDVLFPDAA